jgi:ectoine hydroxylase-related dioxygenase (phytanoyl-CoA dioxygenase family)
MYKSFNYGKVIIYQKEIVNFRSIIAKILKTRYDFLPNEEFLEKNLENLHDFLPKKFQKFESSSETNAVIRDFYNEEFKIKKYYILFLKKILKPIIKKEFYFQKTPTIRFSFPNQKSFNWKPSIHTDIMLGHPIEEINLWLPVTKAQESNSMAIANFSDSLKIIKSINFNFNKFAYLNQKSLKFHKKNFLKLKPLNMNDDSFLIFDPRRLHVTQKNVTKYTRISMDIRIIAKSILDKLKRNYVGTGRRKMKFLPGHYYSQVSI